MRFLKQFYDYKKKQVLSLWKTPIFVIDIIRFYTAAGIKILRLRLQSTI